MLKVPAPSEFPGTGGQGNGIAEGMKSQPQWLNNIKTTGCMSCHALGTQERARSRKISASSRILTEAWERRIQSGQAMTQMVNVVTG